MTADISRLFRDPEKRFHGLVTRFDLINHLRKEVAR